MTNSRIMRFAKTRIHVIARPMLYWASLPDVYHLAADAGDN